MAPTLLGAHYQAHCEQCGYDFDINFSDNHHHRGTANSRPRWMGGATCPMCRYSIKMDPYARPKPGDRILVHKYIYTFSEPRRWDVVVFKAPHLPNTNFIKRLVGLPNESLRLLDGNVYTQTQGQSTWTIARKGDAPKVQRAVWQPIYHSQYIPRDQGQFMGPGERLPSHRWKSPWQVDGGSWEMDGRRSYAYLGGEPGAIEFDFRADGRFAMPAIYTYNQFDRGSFGDELEDIRLGLGVEPETDDTTVSLSTRTRLTGPSQTVTAQISADGMIRLTTLDPETKTELELLSAQGPALERGVATDIELWAVDQELSVWVNGQRELRYLYAGELSEDELINRPPPARVPDVRIELTGGPATLHRVELDRDLYYASNNGINTARGGMIRNPQGRVMADVIKPLTLNDEEFFCIGDNSPLSDDGRFWLPGTDPKNTLADGMWIRHRYFTDDLSDASRDGIVPRELMMGRAFFVYFPAPHPWSSGGMRVIPNFADMRFIH